MSETVLQKQYFLCPMATNFLNMPDTTVYPLRSFNFHLPFLVPAPTYSMKNNEKASILLKMLYLFSAFYIT